MAKNILFKILLMVLLLIVVLYGIENLRSPKFIQQAQDPGNALGMLLGAGQRPYNWCPPGTLKVVIQGEMGEILKEIKQPQDIIAICEIMIGGVDQDQLARARFNIRLKAFTEAGMEISLEQSPGDNLFRVQNLPFSSFMLQKSLQRLSQKGATSN